MFLKHSKIKGFTLIELLVVIAIIGLLSSVLLASLSTVRARARDAKRKADMKTIFTALQIYQDRYGCIPVTTGGTCGVGAGVNTMNTGGWDYSSQGNFMPFLATGTEPILKNVPVDPINNMPGDSTNGTYAYKYYCYPGQGLALGYHPEATTWGIVYYQRYQDPEFICQ
jgi:prepilin-type N-terminal cleavage/methylation domain-containing protein